MGICSMPNVGEAFFPFMIVFNVLLPLGLLKDGVRWVVLHVMTSGCGDAHLEVDDDEEEEEEEEEKEVEVLRLEEVEKDGDWCCVCLHGFEEGEEVSQVVSCRHFFHRECLGRWLGLSHRTCPLCRSQL
ncbi:putative transcription factor C2H2 family [Dioscorea sansibarensis]